MPYGTSSHRAVGSPGWPALRTKRSTGWTRLREAAQQRAGVRDKIYQVIAQLKHVEDANGAAEGDKKQAKELGKQLGKTVEYAPWWVRILSALCLGVGTMIGYKRIVTTLGERLGKIHLTPAQGAAAEVVSAAVIGVAGFTGLPVSTTHIVTSGIGGTMVSSGAGTAVPDDLPDSDGVGVYAAGDDFDCGGDLLPAGGSGPGIIKR